MVYKGCTRHVMGDYRHVKVSTCNVDAAWKVTSLATTRLVSMRFMDGLEGGLSLSDWPGRGGGSRGLSNWAGGDIYELIPIV